MPLSLSLHVRKNAADLWPLSRRPSLYFWWRKPPRRHARRGTHESNDEMVSVYLFILIHGRGHLFGLAMKMARPVVGLSNENECAACVSQMDGCVSALDPRMLDESFHLVRLGRMTRAGVPGELFWRCIMNGRWAPHCRRSPVTDHPRPVETETDVNLFLIEPPPLKGAPRGEGEGVFSFWREVF